MEPELEALGALQEPQRQEQMAGHHQGSEYSLRSTKCHILDRHEPQLL